MYTFIFLLASLTTIRSQFIPSPGNFPATGDDIIAGGIFSSSNAELAIIYPIPPSLATGPESPTSPGAPTSGSGPYPATYFNDSSLINHTVYAPISPPPHHVKLPVVVWANGICQTDALFYQNFLTEIASWGYLVIADGVPGGLGAQSTVAFSRDTIDWATTGGASKYGRIDKGSIATAGHSCGGLESLSAAYHDRRVKRIMLFDISIFEDDKRYLLKAIDVPVAWFNGGPLDFTYILAAKDYKLLNKGLPALKASLDTGHYGTYAATNGGKFAKAAVAYLQWQFRGDDKARAICLHPAAQGSLVSQHWNVTYKNWHGKD